MATLASVVSAPPPTAITRLSNDPCRSLCPSQSYSVWLPQPTSEDRKTAPLQPPQSSPSDLYSDVMRCLELRLSVQVRALQELPAPCPAGPSTFHVPACARSEPTYRPGRLAPAARDEGQFDERERPLRGSALPAPRLPSPHLQCRHDRAVLPARTSEPSPHRPEKARSCRSAHVGRKHRISTLSPRHRHLKVPAKLLQAWSGHQNDHR